MVGAEDDQMTDFTNAFLGGWKIFLSSSLLALTLVSISRVVPGHLIFGAVVEIASLRKALM